MQPSFDKWTSLFLFAASLGFLLALLLFIHKKGNVRANRVLGLFTAIFALNLTLFCFYWAGYRGVYNRMLAASLNGYLLLGPLLLYYWQLLDRKRMAALWLHLLPFIIATIVTSPRIFFIRPVVKLNIWRQTAPALLNIVIPVAIALSLLIYSVLLIVKALQYRKQLNSYALPEEKTKWRWLWQLTCCFALFALSNVVYYVLVYTGALQPEYDYMISFTAAAVIYFIAIRGFRQPEIFNQMQERNGKYERSSLKKEKMTVIAAQLEKLMTEQQPYLDSNLKIQQLAEMAGVSTHHLSQVINDHFGCTYAEYINRLRIQEAMRLLDQTGRHEEKIIGVAFEVGYNNKTTFNLAFKKYTGKTPSEYRKSAGYGANNTHTG